MVFGCHVISGTDRRPLLPSQAELPAPRVPVTLERIEITITVLIDFAMLKRVEQLLETGRRRP